MITFERKQWLASGISTIAVAAALTIATPALAQSENAQLQGHVDGAAAGTQVVAVDTNTNQRSVGRVDAQGNYVILGLRPSQYTVSVAGRPPQTTTVLVGQTVTMDFVETTAAYATAARAVRSPSLVGGTGHPSWRRRSRPTSRRRKSRTCRRTSATS